MALLVGLVGLQGLRGLAVTNDLTVELTQEHALPVAHLLAANTQFVQEARVFRRKGAPTSYGLGVLALFA